MAQTQASVPPASAGDRQGMDIRFVAGEAYELTVRGHRLLVDQPADAGGAATRVCLISVLQAQTVLTLPSTYPWGYQRQMRPSSARKGFSP